MNNDQQQTAPLSDEQLQKTHNVLKVTDWPQSLVMNNRRILTLMPDGEVVFGEGIEPSEAAREFWTFLAHVNPLRAEVERLNERNRFLETALRNSTTASGDVTAYAVNLERQDAAMLSIIQDLAAEVPDWHNAVRLHGLAVTYLAEREK